ncbi:hypothetical protein [Clostridium sp.]|uniref:hypothetical protein n=1 Tax=Clostridium sp. TaxID=1506 RepID=UPI003217DFE7
MKNKIAFIAVGQAGGNIGGLLEKRGFDVLYINTSKEDLDIINGNFKYHISKGEGCNKNRAKAKQLICEDFDNIYEEIESKIEAELIYIIFASGGGTGSGSSPMLAELLLGEGKNVGLITILPDTNESVKAHINSYECFAEIDDIEGLSSCFILDNKNKNKISINGLFVDAFCSFINIPEKHKSIKGNIDKSEIMETLYASGASIIVSENTNTNTIIEKFNDNIFAPIEDNKVIKYISISIAGNTKIEHIQKKVGIPLDTFKTYNKDKTICCLSGLSLPSTRIKEILKVINANKDNITKNLKSTKIEGMNKKFNFLGELEEDKNKKIKKEEKSSNGKKDIMSKYLK